MLSPTTDNNDNGLNCNNDNDISNKIVKSKNKISPIVIYEKNIDEIHEICKNLSIESYNVKIMSNGIKLSVENSDNYADIKNMLISKNKNFYSYQTRSEKPLKVALTGLPLMKTEDILAELKLKNINPIDIKTMNLRKTRFEHQTNYILYFKKGDVKITDLRQVKDINHIIVKWNYYSSKNGPTQCRKCQLFGHGESHCFMKPRCMICAEDHMTSSCKFDKTTVSRNSSQTQYPDHVKCANCNMKHQANDPSCAKRTEYVQIRSKASTNIRYRDRAPVPANNEANFPKFGETQQKYSQHHYSQPSYSQITNSNFSKSNHLQSSDINSNSLFSAHELMNIFKDIVSIVKNCRTKEDQFAAVAEISLKYLSDHHGY